MWKKYSIKYSLFKINKYLSKERNDLFKFERKGKEFLKLQKTKQPTNSFVKFW